MIKWSRVLHAMQSAVNGERNEHRAAFLRTK
jgi:hypothetical protein